MEIVELGSRFPRDYAIIHSAVLSFVCFFGNGYYTRTDGETDSVFVVRQGLGRSGGGRKNRARGGENARVRFDRREER